MTHGVIQITKWVSQTLSSSKKGRSFNEGFTLLEVLVSLAIVAVGIAASAKMITQSITIRDEIEKRFIANLVSSNYLNRLLESHAWQNPMNGASENMAGYEWEVRVEQSTTPNTDIVRIDVSASLNQTEGYGSLFYYKANLNQRSNDN